MKTITITITEEMAHLIFELREIIGKTPYNKEQKEGDSHAHARSCPQLRSCEAKEESEKEEETSPRTPLKEEEREKEERKPSQAAYNARENSSLIPTLEEVKAYHNCLGITTFQPEHFFDHYSARGWKMADGCPVLSWKACLRLWMMQRVNDNTFGSRLRNASASSTPKPSPKLKAPDNRVLFIEPVLPDRSNAISLDEYRAIQKKKGGTGS